MAATLWTCRLKKAGHQLLLGFIWIATDSFEHV
jgi:hypothetical protein